MIAYSDIQMPHISEAARGLPQEKRSLYLQRVNTFLEQRRGGLFNTDVGIAIKVALVGLVHDRVT